MFSKKAKNFLSRLSRYFSRFALFSQSGKVGTHLFRGVPMSRLKGGHEKERVKNRRSSFFYYKGGRRWKK